jgi:hypothetical protein
MQKVVEEEVVADDPCAPTAAQVRIAVDDSAEDAADDAADDAEDAADDAEDAAEDGAEDDDDDDAGVPAAPISSPVPGAECGERFDGPPVSNLRGTYQAQIVVLDGVVIDVTALEAGTSAPESVSVNNMAIPAFRERVIEAQSWDVEAVSGASYTSPAFTESLQGAFEAAGL